MLYIISGASRTGKTIIAKNIMKRKKIPYLSLDWIVMGFTNGLPKYGIHDKLWPDEIAERLWSFLMAMLESMLWLEEEYIIEGEAITPSLSKELLDKHSDKIRICFVGYTEVMIEEKVNSVKFHSDVKRDWLLKESDKYIYNHIENMVTYSKRIRNACVKHNIRYFDTSTKFAPVIEEAIKYLLDES